MHNNNWEEYQFSLMVKFLSLAYEAFEYAIDTRVIQFAVHSQNSYKHVEELLLNMNQHPYRDNCRNTYTLEFCLGHSCTPRLKETLEYETAKVHPQFKETILTKEKVMKALDDNETNPLEIGKMAKELSEAGKFETISGLIRYVKDKRYKS